MVTKFLRKIWVSADPFDPSSPKGYWSETCYDVSDHNPFPVRAHRASRLVRTFRIGGTPPNDSSGFGASDTVLSLRIPLLMFESFREDVLKFYMQSNQGGADLSVNLWLLKDDDSDAVLLKSFSLTFEKTEGASNVTPRHGIPAGDHYVASAIVELDRPLFDNPDDEILNRQLFVRIDLIRQNTTDFGTGWRAVLDVAQL